MRIKTSTITYGHPYCTTISTTYTDVTLATIASAVWAFVKRCMRVIHATIAATKRHIPAWAAVVLNGLIGLALLIPGPLDEMVVMAFIGVFAVFMPAMRADIAASVRNAWAV